MSSPQLDLKRHVSELVSIFLPIFVTIGAAIIILWAIFAPKKEVVEVKQWEERVGLLNAGKDAIFDPAFSVVSPIEMISSPIAARFDAPMGSEHAALTYNAQPFLTTRHLGDDINGIGGEDSDLKDPIYASADGKVVYAGWPSDGWGNIIIINHQLPNGKSVETLYAHLKQMFVSVGTNVKRGEQIGTVGKADGRYLAHLHFEMRSYSSISPGSGYADSALGRLSGEATLKKQRGSPEYQLNAAIDGEIIIPEDGNGISIGIDSDEEAE